MILKLNNIKFLYDNEVVALQDINVNVLEKSFVVILGESGCGKTTLLKVIAGLIDQEEGSIFINDEDVTNLRTSSRDVSMIFQNYVLYPHLTIYHNMMLGLNGFGLSDETKDKNVKAMLTLFGLGNYLNFKPRHLSDGQKQRICIAKALLREPSLFLMDEPLSNLDQPQKLKIMKELKDVYEKTNSSFFYATHDIKDAEMLATKVLVMDKGKIIQEGTLQEIREKPSNLKVFRLTNSGDINEYSIKYDGTSIIHNSFTIPYSYKTEKGEYTLACLAKDVYLDKNGPINGEVLSIKLVNDKVLVNAKLDDGSLINALIDEEEDIKSGDKLRLNIKVNKIKLFNF